MTKVLVTGASGFIGKIMIEYLDSLDDVDCFGTSRHLVPSSNRIICDLLDYEETYSLIDRVAPNVILHLCGGRFDDEQTTRAVNLQTTDNVIRAIKQSKVNQVRLIILGSAAECGKVDTSYSLVDESYICKPLSSYGVIKHEQVTQALKQSDAQCQIIIGRVFNILGPGVSEDLVAGRFAKQIVAIERGQAAAVLKTKSLNGYRDFLDVSDVVRALWVIACHGTPNEIYNICSGGKVSMRELLDMFLSCARVENISYIEENNEKQKSFDVVGDNTKIKTLGGWQAELTLRESVSRTLDSYRNL